MKAEITRGQRSEGRGQKSEVRSQRHSLAFTLIELLVVIAIMAILASLIFPITAAVNKTKIRSRTKSQLNQIATGIETYKSKFGHYPPDHPGNPYVNQLYYELLGTTNLPNGDFATLDGRSALPSAAIKTDFGADGFVNAIRGGGGDEARGGAGPVLQGLQSGQFMLVDGPPGNPNPPIMVLGAKVEGWPPLSEAGSAGARVFIPWCYNSSSPTNNPRSYDLWMDVVIGGKTNRICNWSEKPIIY